MCGNEKEIVVMSFFRNESKTDSQNSSGSRRIWIYPGLILHQKKGNGVLRYVAGMRKADGWIWPNVARSASFQNTVWVTTTSVHPGGRRELTDEVLSEFYLQARKGEQVNGVDYSIVMAVRLPRDAGELAEHCPFFEITKWRP